MKKKTKLTAFLSALLLGAAALGTNAAAYDDDLADFYGETAAYNGITYQVMDDHAVVTEAEDYIKSVSILPDINGYPVTEIYAYAFSECTDLYNIKFPDTLEYIDDGALDGTQWYNSRPNGPVYAGNVLYDYKGDIPENTSITVKDGTVSVSPYAFAGEFDDETFNAVETTGLVSVAMPDSIEIIGYGAFESCTSLENITVPDNKCIKIGEDAFKNTAWYNSQPDGPVYAGAVLYKYKGTVPDNTELAVANTTKAIAASAFYPEQDNSADEEIANTGLTKITLPAGLEYIGDGAFQYCQSLTEISVPDSVKEIGDGAFFDCTSLSSVRLPENIISIGTAQFALCESLKTIVLPESVRFIEAVAFLGAGLTEAEIPLNTEYISSGAFYCPSIKEVTVKNPRCIIEDELSISNNIGDENIYYYGTIKSYKNSYADYFAQYCGYTFDDSLGVVGDVSGNGSIDLYDAVRIAQYIMNMRSFDSNMLMIADYNLDYEVDLYDVIGIAAELLPK